MGALEWLLTVIPGATAAEIAHVYGPGGPLPAMNDAAQAFTERTSAVVDVVGGAMGACLENACADADRPRVALSLSPAPA